MTLPSDYRIRLMQRSDYAAISEICRVVYPHDTPYTEDELAEHHAVLVRPSLRKLHGLTLKQIETILTDLAQHAIVLEPVAGPPAPDPGDQLLWDLLAARADLLLVTGDKLLLNDTSMQGRVVTPAEFFN
jgi:predicted nucleic acid-binding protein